MKRANLDANDLDFRKFLKSAPLSEIETACMYEYMRESQTLRGALNALTEDERRKKSRELPSRFLLSLTPGQFFRLMRALQTAGFPKPWKQLTKESQRQLISLILEWKTAIPALHPPVVIEEASVEFDRYGETADQYYHWRLEPIEPSLLRKHEQSGRRYFFGFIRIDEAYNETEVGTEFRTWFRKRREKTKGGNRERWQAKLNNLVVMRVLKRFPSARQRVHHVAKFTRLKACRDYSAALSAGQCDQPITNAAEAEMSRARGKARRYFQSLFPEQEPLSYRRFTREKVNSN